MSAQTSSNGEHQHGLKNPPKEVVLRIRRRERQDALFSVISKNDVHTWGELFLAALTGQIPQPIQLQRPLLPSTINPDFVLSGGAH